MKKTNTLQNICAILTTSTKLSLYTVLKFFFKDYLDRASTHTPAISKQRQYKRINTAKIYTSCYKCV